MVRSFMQKSTFLKLNIVALFTVFIIYKSSNYFNYTNYSSYQETVLCIKNIEKHMNTNDKSLKKNCPETGIITAEQGGRLGNQIWQYISIWLVAKYTGLVPYVPQCIKSRLCELFENLSIASIDEIGHCVVQPSVTIFFIEEYDLSSNLNIKLERYTYQPDLMGMFYEEAIQQLRIKKNLLEESQRVLHSAAGYFKMKNVTFIGVHVRRTDYILFIQTVFPGKPATVDFYKAAIDYMRTKYKNTIFVVVSDEPEWCADHFQGIKNVYITGVHEKNSSAEQDLAILSSCNHSIIDYGTFGQWGALLAGGETVYWSVSKNYISEYLSRTMLDWHTL